MEYTIEMGSFDDAKLIRDEVYVKELGFRFEFEPKDQDPRVQHLVAYVDGKPVGCARVFPVELEKKLPGDDSHIWVFGRLAVLPEYRNNGIGTALLEKAEEYAKSQGATEMHLHAQPKVQAFFAKRGYEAYGPLKYDEKIVHQWMKKEL